MKTVKDYKQQGLVFIKGDYINTFYGKKENPLNRSGVKYCNNSIHNDEKFAVEFAWRNNDGIKPEYKGLIDVCFECGTVSHNESTIDFEWSLDDENYIAKWRPSVLQSESPTVSTKEDKPMKPVYTAEMHAKGELPPVGSEVKVCIEEAGFELEGNDPKHECKVVTVKAAFVNKDGEKIAAIENDKGNCACYIIECIKPIIKTIKVNGFDVPAPMIEAPDYGSIYFKAEISNVSEKFCDRYCWGGTLAGNVWLKRGIIHSNESAAIAHAKAMLGINPTKGAK